MATEGPIEAVRGEFTRALCSSRSAPGSAGPGATHGHGLAPADAQLALPPARRGHSASPRRVPAARPPAARAGGPAPHPAHLRRRRHHAAQRQRRAPQRGRGRRASGGPRRARAGRQGRGEEEREGKGRRASAVPLLLPSHRALEEAPCGNWFPSPDSLGILISHCLHASSFTPPPSSTLLWRYLLADGKQG